MKLLFVITLARLATVLCMVYLFIVGLASDRIPVIVGIFGAELVLLSVAYSLKFAYQLVRKDYDISRTSGTHRDNAYTGTQT